MYIFLQVRESGKGVDCRVVTFNDNSKSDINEKHISDTNQEQEDESFKHYCRRAIQIDEFSRLGFPLAFLIFNILYWNYYTQWSKW